MSRKIYWFLAILVTLPWSTVKADIFEYYIGRDSRPTILSGTYAGLPNPNLNRLTFLYAHTSSTNPSSNHYHSKGAYSYTGPNLGASTAVNDFNGPSFGVFNILPENSSTNPNANKIWMREGGTGFFANKFRTGIDTTPVFNLLTIRSVDSLAGFPANTPETFLHTSGSERFQGSMAGSNVLLELVSISPGLGIFDSSGTNLFPTVGSQYNLGSGSSIDFTPIFAVDDTVTPGSQYDAVFKLIDTGTGNSGGPWLDGGRFIFRVTAVPEPSSAALLGTCCLGLIRLRRRRLR